MDTSENVQAPPVDGLEVRPIRAVSCSRRDGCDSPVYCEQINDCGSASSN